MALSRPPADQLFAVVGLAMPLLKELEAAKATIVSYTETVEKYQALLKAEQDKAAAIQAQLGVYSDQIAGLYTQANSEGSAG